MEDKTKFKIDAYVLGKIDSYVWVGISNFYALHFSRFFVTAIYLGFYREDLSLSLSLRARRQKTIICEDKANLCNETLSETESRVIKWYYTFLIHLRTIYMGLVVSKEFSSLHRRNSVVWNAQINRLVCSWSDSLLTQIRWKQIACRKIAFIASKLWWRACETIRTSFTIKIITSSSGISYRHNYMVYWDHRDFKLPIK